MDHQLPIVLIIIVQSWLVLGKNEVRFKADNVMKKPSKLINFTANDDVWSRVLLKISLMLRDLTLEFRRLLCQSFDLVPACEHFEEILFLSQ